MSTPEGTGNVASMVLTFPLLRDCTSSFPVQVSWRAFKIDAQKSEETESRESRFLLEIGLLAPPDAVDIKVNMIKGRRDC